jgi:hypothetical protein
VSPVFVGGPIATYIDVFALLENRLVPPFLATALSLPSIGAALAVVVARIRNASSAATAASNG